MDVVVQDTKRHLGLPTRHARRWPASWFGRRWRRLSWWVRRINLSPRRPVPSNGRRTSEVYYLRVAECLEIAVFINVPLLLAIGHQPDTPLRLRQSQIRMRRSPRNRTTTAQRPRDPNSLITRFLRQRRQPRRDFRSSCTRPIGISTPKALVPCSSHHWTRI